jgi:hypothetical protein
MSRLVLVLLATAGCPGPDELACVEGLDPACAPLVDPPTFDAVYTETLHPTCASGSGTCHSRDAAKGGLVFEDPDESYGLLTGSLGGRPRVVPGDPSCSLVVERLHADDPEVRMPPGPTPLPDAEACLIQRWIADGAQR